MIKELNSVDPNLSEVISELGGDPNISSLLYIKESDSLLRRKQMNRNISLTKIVISFCNHNDPNKQRCNQRSVNPTFEFKNQIDQWCFTTSESRYRSVTGAGNNNCTS
ncbi:hypothetical protein PPL_09967 [Heterostelium album PN500]|uniref:Uncharacterized protein n=1 Tax=Heterostelium pallidum (strain ATCC 26659 / Pp 5 / PN500) TaxID=670386 RepID=D3BPS3_HETP5|nr:hypothetical protein PPL_09967 [Heterostelium album PN500]EFA76206.1 hypothetical protein PPL_09967 [Heterostelium album PN500]|eukprot:XP_020428339.1 hypothetical protein PPL_09967 [Heterostelium album PN500]